jgi:hypothetical protein
LLSAGEWVPILEVGLEPGLGWWCCIVDTAADIAGGDELRFFFFLGGGVGMRYARVPEERRAVWFLRRLDSVGGRAQYDGKTMRF